MPKNKFIEELDADIDKASIVHKVREFLRANGWWLILLSFLASMAIGFIGFNNYKVDNKTGWSTSDCIYGTIQLIILESGGFSAGLVGTKNIWFEWARFLVPIFSILAVLKTLAKIAGDQLDLLLIKIFFKHHVIICGLGEKGKHLAKEHYKARDQVVVVDIDENNENLSSIITYKSSLFRLGIKAVAGNATDKILLNKLKVHEAKALYAFTPLDDINLKIALRACDVLNEMHGITVPKLQCKIHILSEDLFGCLHRNDPFASNNEFDAEIFNIYEHFARIMFREHSPDKYNPIDRNRKEPVSILLVGAGWYGEKLLHQIIRTGHFANLQSTQVTVIDRNGDALNALEQRLHNFKKTNYVEVITQHQDITTTNPQVNEIHSYDIAYVCVGDDNLGLVCADHLRNKGYIPDISRPIVVAMPQKNSLSDVLEKSMKKKGIFFFKTITESIPKLLDKAVDDIAIKVHRAWNLNIVEDKEVIDCWKNNPDYRDSSRSNADHLDIKLRAINCRQAYKCDVSQDHIFTEDEYDLLAQMEHRRYYTERLLQGWSYGEEKQSDKKIGPYVKCFEELTDDQKIENKKQFVILIDNLSKLGMRIV